jgi:hypothetical protein
MRRLQLLVQVREDGRPRLLVSIPRFLIDKTSMSQPQTRSISHPL